MENELDTLKKLGENVQQKEDELEILNSQQNAFRNERVQFRVNDNFERKHTFQNDQQRDTILKLAEKGQLNNNDRKKIHNIGRNLANNAKNWGTTYTNTVIIEPRQDFEQTKFKLPARKYGNGLFILESENPKDIIEFNWNNGKGKWEWDGKVKKDRINVGVRENQPVIVHYGT